MPVYEFECGNCAARVSVLMAVDEDYSGVVCVKCGMTGLRKVVSRFRRGRDESARMGEIGDRLDMMGEPGSGGAVREFVKEMGRGMDIDMSDVMEELFEADMEGVGQVDLDGVGDLS